jgi:hypothetical protein
MEVKIMKIKIGTIGKCHLKITVSINPNTKERKTIEQNVSGVIVRIPQYRGDSYGLVDICGKETEFKDSELMSVKAIHIDKDIRTQLSLIAKEYECLHKLEKEREEIQTHIFKTRNEINKKIKVMTNISGFYSENEFKEKINSFGYEVVATAYEGKSMTVTLQQSSEGDRFTIPDVNHDFPFIYQEYDGRCFVNKNNAPKEYQSYLHKNSPELNVSLAQISSNVYRDVCVGDKYVYATTNYCLHLKNGYTKKDVNKIVEAISFV